MGATIVFADGRRARVHGGEWSSDDPRVRHLLEDLARHFDTAGYVPDFDGALAKHAAATLGGRVIIKRSRRMPRRRGADVDLAPPAEDLDEGGRCGRCGRLFRPELPMACASFPSRPSAATRFASTVPGGSMGRTHERSEALRAQPNGRP